MMRVVLSKEFLVPPMLPLAHNVGVTHVRPREHLICVVVNYFYFREIYNFNAQYLRTFSNGQLTTTKIVRTVKLLAGSKGLVLKEFS